MDGDTFNIEFNSFFKKKRVSNQDQIQVKRTKSDQVTHDESMNSENTSIELNESKSSEIPTRNIKYISIESIERDNILSDFVENHVLLAIVEESQGVCFKGKLQLQVLSGKVEVNGYEMRASNRLFNLYSPESNSFLSINNCNEHQDTIDVMKLSQQFVSNLKIDDCIQERFDRVKQFISKYSLRQKSSLIVLNKLDSKLINYLSYFDSYRELYASYDQHNSITQFSNLGLYPIDTNETKKILKISQKEKEIIDRLIRDESTNKVFLACGGKDAGKSTFLRYLTNSLLNTYEQVAYLDCDPGQSEFTLSGCVQLTFISEPLLGPPHTHLQHNPETCYFLGHLSPNDIPSQYLECIRQCVDYFTNLKNTQIPLLVNTMGWNQGLGLCLLKEQMVLTQPTYVIQLNSSDANKNLSVIDETWWQSTTQWPANTKENTKFMPKFELFTINRDTVESKVKKSRSYSSKDHRTISIIAYFANLQNDAFNFKYLNQLKPYVISWSEFAVHVAHVNVSHDEIFRILNASLVGLCVVDEKYIIYDSQSQFPGKLNVSKNVIYRCVGFGIVRGIKMDTKEIYMLTPESHDRLNMVNLLVKGMLNLPLEFFYDNNSSSSSPYVTFADNLNTINRGEIVANEPYQRKYLVHQHASNKK